jgi:alpha-glucosidase
MDSMGFLRPCWTWLRDPDGLPGELGTHFIGLPVPVPRLPGGAVVDSMRAFRSGISWPAVLDSWKLLDCHDVARFRTVSGSRERHLVGVGLQMTTPGVPMVYAGDEIGLEGIWGEDGRRPMPWSDEARWDTTLLAGFRELIALRRSSEALATGGIRYAHVSDDAIAYLREAPGERLLCLASRAAHAPIELSLAALGGTLERLYGGEAQHIDGAVALPGDGPAFHVWRING